jgi:hypothetical protein
VIVVALLHLVPSNNPNTPAAAGIGTGIRQSGQTGQTGLGSSAVALTSSEPASSAGVSGDAVRWHGQVLLSVDGVDLDSVPVNDASGSNASLYNSTIGFNDAPSSLTAEPIETTTLAAWTGSATPGRTQCLDQVESQGVNSLSITDGDDVCAVSLGRHVALMKIIDTAANGGILADVTVWAQTADATSSPAG